MSNCKRPCTIALSGPGRFTCLFGDLAPTLHAGDILSVVAACADAEGGLAQPRQESMIRRIGASELRVRSSRRVAVHGSAPGPVG